MGLVNQLNSEPEVMLLMLHWVVLAIALVIWLLREPAGGIWNMLADVLGAVCVGLAIMMAPLFQQELGDGSNGRPAHWFLIFTLFSGFLLPIVTVSIHILAGRAIGRALRWVYPAIRAL